MKNQPAEICAERRAGRVILFIGAPGSGKGTQSALLASQSGIPVISTGEILRAEAKRNTPAGFRLRQTLASGELVEDRVVCEAVAARIAQWCGVHREPPVDPSAPGSVVSVRRDQKRRGGSLILDGFPRTVAQARMLDSLLENLGIASPLVLHLDVPADVLRRRLVCRRQCAICGAVYNLASERSGRGSRCQIDGGALVERDDDSGGIVERRLATYEAETLPVLNYYRRAGGGTRSDSGYRRLDGDRSAAEIANEVREIVGLTGTTAVAA